VPGVHFFDQGDGTLGGFGGLDRLPRREMSGAQGGIRELIRNSVVSPGL
jgi:hypothetical protein